MMNRHLIGISKGINMNGVRYLRTRANKTNVQVTDYLANKPVYSSDKNIPFIHNPFYKIQFPLSDKTRMDIFNLYESDPAKWSPFALAEVFGISIIRVQAILKLKSLQKKHLEQNKEIQENLVSGMEKLLNPITIRYNEMRKNPIQQEPMRENTIKTMNPFVQLLEEEETLTAEDAAMLMKLEPHVNVEIRLNEKAKKAFEGEIADSEEETIGKDVVVGGKHAFMIRETEGGVFIREREGILRKASRSEILLNRSSRGKFRM